MLHLHLLLVTSKNYVGAESLAIDSVDQTDPLVYTHSTYTTAEVDDIVDQTDPLVYTHSTYTTTEVELAAALEIPKTHAHFDPAGRKVELKDCDHEDCDPFQEMHWLEEKLDRVWDLVLINITEAKLRVEDMYRVAHAFAMVYFVKIRGRTGSVHDCVMYATMVTAVGIAVTLACLLVAWHFPRALPVSAGTEGSENVRRSKRLSKNRDSEGRTSVSKSRSSAARRESGAHGMAPPHRDMIDMSKSERRRLSFFVPDDLLAGSVDLEIDDVVTPLRASLMDVVRRISVGSSGSRMDIGEDSTKLGVAELSESYGYYSEELEQVPHEEEVSCVHEELDESSPERKFSPPRTRSGRQRL